MEHVGVVVEDLAAAIEFFVELGLELVAEWPAEGEWVDRILGLDGARAENAMLQAPDGGCQIELIKFLSPPSPTSVTSPSPSTTSSAASPPAGR